jgi:hypothetical protein
MGCEMDYFVELAALVVIVALLLVTTKEMDRLASLRKIQAEELKSIAEQRQLHVDMLEEGKEVEVETEIWLDYRGNRHITVRMDTGEVHAVRALTYDERQRSLVESNAEAPAEVEVLAEMWMRLNNVGEGEFAVVEKPPIEDEELDAPFEEGWEGWN